MRRLAALAALLVLSLSRFGAAAPVHAGALEWTADQTSHALAAPAIRLAAHGLRELAPRVAPRTHAPCTPHCAARAFTLGIQLEGRGEELAWAEPRLPGGWHRFTYDATAPPHLS
ncbi:MAG: hypothetical protein ABI601_10635 [bacterium]